MAEATVSETALAYTKGDAEASLKNVAQAVAIIRAVQVAADAVKDGAMKYEFDHVTRWGPAIGAATHRLSLVKDVFTERTGAPSLNWFTSLTLLEAFDAAMWHAGVLSDVEGLDADNVKDMCEAIISELGNLKLELAECQ